MQVKNFNLSKNFLSLRAKLPIFFSAFILITLAGSIYYLNFSQNKIKDLGNKNASLDKQLKTIDSKLAELKNQDQYKVNEGLKKDIKNIETTYKESLSSYERLLDLRVQKAKTADLENQFAKVLNYLSSLNYSSASADLKLLSENIKKVEDSLTQTETAQIANVTVNNSAPGSGFSQQKVSTDRGEFLVSIVAADLN